MDDVRHEVVAAASSSSKERAAAFLKDIGAGAGAKAYGSYAELVDDPDVDIVYVATPHSHHFQNVMLALERGGKPVLCEKAFTVTAAQARALVAAARAKGLFLMEAVWTRYFPISVQIRALVQAGAIGTVYRVVADNSINSNDVSAPSASPSILSFPNAHRMVNPDLAGGALLDLGIYSLTWLFQILYHLQPQAGADKEAPQVVAAINKYAHTGADESTTVVLGFPRHQSQGIAMTSLRVGTGVGPAQQSGPAILIQGSAGEIQVMGPAYKPLQYRVIKRAEGAGGAAASASETPWIDVPIPQDTRAGATWGGHGMFWEADEAARCLRDGQKESATLPLSESIVIMETMEEALRQGAVAYPELITSSVYDENSPLNTGKA